MLHGWVWTAMARLSTLARAGEKRVAKGEYIFGPDKVYTTALITCFGIPSSDLPPIVASVEKRLRSFEKRVYFVDTSDFTVFLKIGAPFEYLPPAEDRERYLGEADWGAYLRSHYARLSAKWHPSITISYGTPVEEFLGGAAPASLD